MSRDDLLAWIPSGHPDESLVREVNFDRLPVHVAIIMDGNGRWAAQRHLPRVEGHRAGIDAVRALIDARYEPHAYNVGFNDGAAAGQTVMHFHVHVIPRYQGDVSDPRGGVRWVLADKAAYWLSTEQ